MSTARKDRGFDVRSLSSKQLQSVADFLRNSVPSHDSISIERRVTIFSGKDAVTALLSAKKSVYPLDGSLTSPEQAKHLLLVLLNQGFFIKASVNGTREVPLTAMQQAMIRVESASGDPTAPLPKPEVIFLVSPDPSLSWSDDINFIWIYEGSKIWTTLISFGILLAAFCIIMYPLWPYRMKLLAWYLSMVALGLLGLLFGLAIVRFILFVASRILGLPGFWLFPRLFDDCGVLESFYPIYGWDPSWTSAPPSKAKSM